MSKESVQKKQKIAVIGGGNLGRSIIEGLLKSNYVKPSDITVTRRRVEALQDLAAEGVNTSKDNAKAVGESEVIILAIKPKQIKHVLEEIQHEINPEKHLLISVVTGIGLKEIQSVIGVKVPLFRAMPNTAIAIGESMTCISTNNAGENLQQKVLGLFDQMGKSVMIDENLMAAATVLGACGIAYALRFIRAASQGGIEIGFNSELSQLIAAQTVKGASSLLIQSGHHPEYEIDKVTTPQGCTIAGLNEMEHQGFSSSLIKGVLTSYNQIASIAKDFE
ncbi:pyrroline-5-carboxylate reductase [Rapidithrix thailandica]|uniref:Pyrroline-5-carboxylate reductase n=1 Tax=Rapidithrix thailandica TaxID=413964 RepID=A0AAW9S0T2_9BACT